MNINKGMFQAVTASKRVAFKAIHEIKQSIEGVKKEIQVLQGRKNDLIVQIISLNLLFSES